jgi:hypothetical protein
MSEGLKPVGFQKARVIAICAKAEPMAMVTEPHNEESASCCGVKMLCLRYGKGNK